MNFIAQRERTPHRSSPSASSKRMRVPKALRAGEQNRPEFSGTIFGQKKALISALSSKYDRLRERSSHGLSNKNKSIKAKREESKETSTFKPSILQSIKQSEPTSCLKIFDLRTNSPEKSRAKTRMDINAKINNNLKRFGSGDKMAKPNIGRQIRPANTLSKSVLSEREELGKDRRTEQRIKSFKRSPSKKSSSSKSNSKAVINSGYIKKYAVNKLWFEKLIDSQDIQKSSGSLTQKRSNLNVLRKMNYRKGFDNSPGSAKNQWLELSKLQTSLYEREVSKKSKKSRTPSINSHTPSK